jgi:hypothetical protein
VLGTLPLNTSAPTPKSSRRGFLVQATAVAAGGAALGASLPLPASLAATAHSEASVDPILAAIEAHKAARITLYRSIDVHNALERELPKDNRRSRIKFFEETIYETDDPRWIEIERDVIRCHDAEADAAIELLGVPAITRAGILALLHYANEADIDGEGWPDALVSDDGTKTRSWHDFLIEKVAEDLSGAAA